MKLTAFVLSVLALVQPVFAEDSSPVFGSATQAPIVIVIDPATGQPIAATESQPKILLTTR